MFYCDPALVLKFGWTLAVMSRNMTNISIVTACIIVLDGSKSSIGL